MRKTLAQNRCLIVHAKLPVAFSSFQEWTMTHQVQFEQCLATRAWFYTLCKENHCRFSDTHYVTRPLTTCSQHESQCWDTDCYAQSSVRRSAGVNVIMWRDFRAINKLLLLLFRGNFLSLVEMSHTSPTITHYCHSQIILINIKNIFRISLMIYSTIYWLIHFVSWLQKVWNAPVAVAKGVNSRPCSLCLLSLFVFFL